MSTLQGRHILSRFAFALFQQSVVPFVSRSRGGAGEEHLPGGQIHWKRLTLSRHSPLFTQGLLWHSLISSSQCTPLNPGKDNKEWQKGFRKCWDVGYTLFQDWKSKLDLTEVEIPVCIVIFDVKRPYFKGINTSVTVEFSTWTLHFQSCMHDLPISH